MMVAAAITYELVPPQRTVMMSGNPSCLWFAVQVLGPNALNYSTRGAALYVLQWGYC
jgi:hypothetical protein